MCGRRQRSDQRRGHADRQTRGPLEERQVRSEEHTSELQSRLHLVCRLLLETKKTYQNATRYGSHAYRRSSTNVTLGWPFPRRTATLTAAAPPVSLSPRRRARL